MTKDGGFENDICASVVFERNPPLVRLGPVLLLEVSLDETDWFEDGGRGLECSLSSCRSLKRTWLLWEGGLLLSEESLRLD